MNVFNRGTDDGIEPRRERFSSVAFCRALQTPGGTFQEIHPGIADAPIPSESSPQLDLISPIGITGMFSATNPAK